MSLGFFLLLIIKCKKKERSSRKGHFKRSQDYWFWKFHSLQMISRTKIKKSFPDKEQIQSPLGKIWYKDKAKGVAIKSFG